MTHLIIACVAAIALFNILGQGTVANAAAFIAFVCILAEGFARGLIALIFGE